MVPTHRDKITRMDERYRFAFSKSRIGRWHGLRVILIIAAIALLTWYGKYSSDNPIDGKKIVRVHSDGNAYAVTCVVGTPGRVAAELNPSAEREERRTFDNRAAFKDVYPLADSVRATLLTFSNADILVCDTSIFSSTGASPFRERLELLIIPSSSKENILRLRDILRPRYTAVIPPCDPPSVPNIICNPVSPFMYEFEIRKGKIRF